MASRSPGVGGGRTHHATQSRMGMHQAAGAIDDGEMKLALPNREHQNVPRQTPCAVRPDVRSIQTHQPIDTGARDEGIDIAHPQAVSNWKRSRSP